MVAVALAVVVAAVVPARAADSCQEAARAYDLDLASRALVEVRARDRGTASATSAADLARCALTVAELMRIRFETSPKSATGERTALGQRIDLAAEEGLAALDRVAAASETSRLRADLISTMIRSPFRAKQLEPTFRAAVAAALALDPANPRALVSQAKPLIFADPAHGGDPAAARSLLDRALTLAPDLESALLLRALACELTGDMAGAAADWRRALALNPACAPARDRLAGAATR